MGFRVLSIEYKKAGNEERGECICSIFRHSILFFIQYSSILLPEVNPITLQFCLVAEFNTERVSVVFPDTVVVTTSVSEFTVFGK